MHTDTVGLSVKCLLFTSCFQVFGHTQQNTALLRLFWETPLMFQRLWMDPVCLHVWWLHSECGEGLCASNDFCCSPAHICHPCIDPFPFWSTLPSMIIIIIIKLPMSHRPKRCSKTKDIFQFRNDGENNLKEGGKKRESFFYSTSWRADNPACKTLKSLHPPTNRPSIKMHRKTQRRQDKVRSRSWNRSAPWLLSDKAQGIWFMPSIFSSKYNFFFFLYNRRLFCKVCWSDISEAFRYPSTQTLPRCYISIIHPAVASWKTPIWRECQLLVKIPPRHPTKYQKYHLFKC